ncbi:hypothetical protein BKA70DRAFT_1306760 [Coprinopsis sp. MPI-PUGE-AT-0042]|nr:hypothetical protein BKA70DRAFT_1306760 [Coprinopsis sp. MPI-PUGE-AT-0042]
MLLERNDSQPNAASDYGNTPLMCASEQGHRDVVDILLEQTNIQLDLTNKGGKTAYDLAMEKNHQAVLRSILRRERRVSASTGKQMLEK